MNKQSITHFLLATLAFLGLLAVTAVTCVAATAGLDAITPAVAQLPWQLALIPVLTPLIIAGVKLLIPKIKTALIPIIAPALGLVLAVISSLTTGHELNAWLAMALGLAGVGAREIVDQLKQAVDAA